MSDVRDIIEKEIDEIINNVTMYASSDYCIPCHIIFNISSKLEISEADAADLLSNALSEEALNEKFINAVEMVHMKGRNKALQFYNKSRDAKNRYLQLYIKNAITELKNDDALNYGKDITLRKLLLSYLSGYIAQTLGLDFHSSTEELYYILRKEKGLEDFITEFIEYLQHV